LELLEERSDALILLDDEKKLHVLGKNSYTLLKYKFYRGKKIRFTTGKISLEELDQDGVFVCNYNELPVTVRDSKIQVADAIFRAQEKGDPDGLWSLWSLKYAESFLAIKVESGARSQVELTREGRLSLPEAIRFHVTDWIEHPDGARIVKAVLSRAMNQTSVDRIFTHEVVVRGLTKLIINDIAVSLLGRDETGQYWMHVVPPEYRESSIGSCEVWLAGGEVGKDQLM